MKKAALRSLLWAPVILLPLSNLVFTFSGSWSYDTRNRILWTLGAAAEELFFRYFLLKRVLLDSTAVRPRRAIVLVAVGFAAMHLFNLHTGAAAADVLVQSAFALCFSLWAGAAVWRTGSVWIPLSAHMLLNLTSPDDMHAAAALFTGAVMLADGILLMFLRDEGEREPRRNRHTG